MDWLLFLLAELDKRVWSPYFTELEACVVMESKQQKTKILLRGAGSSLVSCEPNPGDPDCLSTAWWLSVLSVSPLPSRNCYWLQHQRTLGIAVLPRCPLLPSWLAWRVLKRAPGSLVPGDPTRKGGPWDWWEPHPATYSSVKHISAFCRFSYEKKTMPLRCWLSNICKASWRLL